MASLSSIEALFSPPATVKPISKPQLTQDQETKLESLISHFGGDYTLPVKQNAEEQSSLTDREMMFLSKETFVRFLVATKDDLQATITRLEGCLQWRRFEDIDDVERMSKVCEPESTTGKNVALGFSVQGQPILYFFPNASALSYEDPKTIERFNGSGHPMVYMLERAKDFMCAGVTNTFVIFQWSGKKQGPSTPISVVKATNHILSNYYPETLGCSSFQDMPWMYKTIINLIWPFVDPNTKKKVKFASTGANEIVKEGLVDTKQLLKEAGGDLNVPYTHDVYWPALLKTCLKIREEEEARWRAIGERQVGRAENLFKRPIPATSE
ncbi:uncharacterized protein L201_001246 [Kwoniella dendrophila CBS 6074]|uniref:CRAL-TRIO domain-containing protein n=1 Tax=Kwoniella dendrophila CBS 6074 TaxID=1295534 RepID=A0AAX4JP88_9TREE